MTSIVTSRVIGPRPMSEGDTTLQVNAYSAPATPAKNPRSEGQELVAIG
jgi:hypothetical protein